MAYPGLKVGLLASFPVFRSVGVEVTCSLLKSVQCSIAFSVLFIDKSQDDVPLVSVCILRFKHRFLCLYFRDEFI